MTGGRTPFPHRGTPVGIASRDASSPPTWCRPVACDGSGRTVAESGSIEDNRSAKDSRPARNPVLSPLWIPASVLPSAFPVDRTPSMNTDPSLGPPADTTPDEIRGVPLEFLGTDLGLVLQAYRPYLLRVAGEVLPKALVGKVGPSDLVQETLLRGYREFPEFSGADLGELIAWLRQILVNQVNDHVRRYETNKRQIHREVRLINDVVDVQSPSPSQPLLTAEEWNHLQKGLDQLPTLHREVILLRHREGYTFGQIGELLGKSPDAIRKLWGRALENLQLLLGPRQ